MNKLRNCHARIPGEYLLNGMVKEVGKSAYILYTILALHQDWQTYTCFPSQKTITKLTGMDHKTIKKAVDVLVEKHYITSLEYRKPLDKDGKEYGKKRYYYTIR